MNERTIAAVFQRIGSRPAICWHGRVTQVVGEVWWNPQDRLAAWASVVRCRTLPETCTPAR